MFTGKRHREPPQAVWRSLAGSFRFLLWIEMRRQDVNNPLFDRRGDWIGLWFVNGRRAGRGRIDRRGIGRRWWRCRGRRNGGIRG